MVKSAKNNKTMEETKIQTLKAPTKEMPKVQKSKVDDIFTLVETKDGVRITIGNFIMTKRTFKNFEQADKYLAKKPYEILINVASFIAAQTINDNANAQKN